MRERNREIVSYLFLIPVPAVGILYSILRFFYPVYVPTGQPGSVVSVTGVDCVLGRNTVASCTVLLEIAAVLFVSIFIIILMSEPLLKHLSLLSTILFFFGFLIYEYNLGKILIVSASLIAVGSIIGQYPELREHLRNRLQQAQ